MKLKLYARYGGECSECEKDVQATRRVQKTKKPSNIWIRCKGCGKRSNYPLTGEAPV